MGCSGNGTTSSEEEDRVDDRCRFSYAKAAAQLESSIGGVQNPSNKVYNASASSASRSLLSVLIVVFVEGGTIIPYACNTCSVFDVWFSCWVDGMVTVEVKHGNDFDVESVVLSVQKYVPD
jgi:hypothetical protein